MSSFPKMTFPWFINVKWKLRFSKNCVPRNVWLQTRDLKKCCLFIQLIRPNPATLQLYGSTARTGFLKKLPDWPEPDIRSHTVRKSYQSRNKICKWPISHLIIKNPTKKEKLKLLSGSLNIFVSTLKHPICDNSAFGNAGLLYNVSICFYKVPGF